jgi:hypothetical protein
MADISIFRGVWIYRSFLNAPSVVGDFNKLAVWEAELSLDVSDDGRLYGYLAERPSIATGAEPYLYVEGEILLDNPLGGAGVQKDGPRPSTTVGCTTTWAA